MANTQSQNTCPICNSNNRLRLFSAQDRLLHVTEEKFDLMYCPNCKVVATYPQPSQDQIGKYYPSEYYPLGEASQSYYDNYIGRFQKDKIAQIQRYKQGGRILDVGCGVGFFIKEAQKVGYVCDGIEFSSAAAEAGKKKLGLNIVCANFLNYPIPPSTYDIVTLWHVFEHLYEPLKVLSKIKEILVPGGLLVIAVPNFSSIQSKIFKKRWYHLTVPRHLYHYSDVSLKKLVMQSGYTSIDIDYFCYEHNGGGILGSLMRLSPPGESFTHKLIRKTIASYACNSLAWIESGLGRGGTFTLFANKD